MRPYRPDRLESRTEWTHWTFSIMRRVLDVSRSGFHAWQARNRPRAHRGRALDGRIAEIHQRFRGVYGSPRIHSELVLADGERLGRKRVERLMRQAAISGLVRRRRGRGRGRTHDPRAWGSSARTSSTARSRLRARTGSGSPTSPTSEPGRAGSIGRPSRAHLAAARLASPKTMRFTAPTTAALT